MQFRGYRIDAVHRTVTTPDGRVIRIEPQAFDLLLYFTEHPEETLSRERLIADVWGGKFVTDDAVMVAVYALRQAFDDDSRSPKFIETIRGRGYRWIASPDAATPETVAPPAKRATSFAPLWAALLAIGVTAVVWAVLRPPQAMPSMEQTTELVRAHARGVFFSERVTRRDLEQARAEFRKAIAIDDRYAEPHAALAQVCVRLVETGVPEAEMREADARREAARAIELAPKLALSQAALASVQFVFDRDAAKAEQSYRDAIQLDPSLPGIHRRYSYLLGASGRFTEATQEAKLAADMEPASSGALSDLAWTYLLNGQLAEAEHFYREALRLDPKNSSTLFALGYCLDLRNEPADAMQSYRGAMQAAGAPQELLTRSDAAFAASGLPAVYAFWLERVKGNKAIPRFVVAFYAARAGRDAEAIDLLKESERRREPASLWLAVHPAFASLRGHRDFAGLAASSFHTR